MSLDDTPPLDSALHDEIAVAAPPASFDDPPYLPVAALPLDPIDAPMAESVDGGTRPSDLPMAASPVDALDDGPTRPTPLPPPRPPRPPVVAVETADGWRTANLTLRPTGSAAYVDFCQDDKIHKVFVSTAALRNLMAICADENREPAAIWRAFSDIPLDRPLPSRSLGEELRVTLRALARR